MVLLSLLIDILCHSLKRKTNMLKSLIPKCWGRWRKRGRRI